VLTGTPLELQRQAPPQHTAGLKQSQDPPFAEHVVTVAIRVVVPSCVVT